MSHLMEEGDKSCLAEDGGQFRPLITRKLTLADQLSVNVRSHPGAKMQGMLPRVSGPHAAS